MLWFNRVAAPSGVATVFFLSLVSLPGQCRSAAADPIGQSVRVDVNEYDVEGNTVLSTEEIEEAVYPFLGPERPLQDLEGARSALELAYRRKGFVSVSVELPDQHVVDGQVVLVVRERRVDSIKVAGASSLSAAKLSEAVPAMAPGTVPNTLRAERQIKAFDRPPDRQVKAALVAGSEPGTVNVDYQVADEAPLHASLELDNQYSVGTKPLRLITTASYSNLWDLGHTLQGAYFVAPQDRGNAEVFQGSYLAPLDQSWTVEITGTKASSNVPIAGSSTVLGNGDIVALRLAYSPQSSPEFAQTLFAEADYKHFLEGFTEQDAASISGVPLLPVTYYPLLLGYSGTLTEPNATTRLTTTFGFALRGVGAHLENFGAAPSNFAYLRADLERLQRLPSDAELLLRTTAQIAANRLPAHEQYGMGGLSSVRGYLESETLADDSLDGSVEISSPSFGAKVAPAIRDWRIFAFWDGAIGHLDRPYPFEPQPAGLMSAGLGTSIQLLDRWNGMLDFAWPLTDGPITPAGAMRSQFRLWTVF